MYNDDKILSHPLRLVWNGWESNTYALQNAGWELSVAEDVERMRMAIALRHKEFNFRGLTDFIDFDFFRRPPSMYQSTDTNSQHYPTFGCRLASDITIQIREAGNRAEFNPIDARPMYQSHEMRQESLDRIAHFRKLEKPSDEIFLKSASMEDILNMALERQEPQQVQMRKAQVRQNEMDVMRSSRLKANLRLVA